MPPGGEADARCSGNLLANDIDLEGDTQSVLVTAIAAPSHGQLILVADGAFLYTPDAGYAGSDQFTYRVCDDGTPRACTLAVADMHIFPPNLGWDFGDAPNFPVSLTADGPRHAIVEGLRLGDRVDAEADGTPSAMAVSDDETDLDDESVITLYPRYDGSGVYSLDLPVTNLTPYAAQLVGWIDWNVNFSFDDAGERSSPMLTGDNLVSDGAADDSFATGNVPPGYVGLVRLTWAGFDIPTAENPTKVVRLRLAADLPGSAAFFSAAGPSIAGPATGGLVIDTVAPIVTQRVLVSSFTASSDGGDDDTVDFAWTTALENEVDGFNLLVERGSELTQINPDLIASKVTNSTTDTFYTYSYPVGGDVFYLQAVMLSGETLLYGPTQLDVIPPPITDIELYLPRIFANSGG